MINVIHADDGDGEKIIRLIERSDCFSSSANTLKYLGCIFGFCLLGVCAALMMNNQIVAAIVLGAVLILIHSLCIYWYGAKILKSASLSSKTVSPNHVKLTIFYSYALSILNFGFLAVLVLAFITK